MRAVDERVVQDRVAFSEPIEVGCGVEFAAGYGGRDALGPNMLDVRLAAPERLDLGRIQVNPVDGEPRFTKHEPERKTAVALADHAQVSGAVLDPVTQ